MFRWSITFNRDSESSESEQKKVKWLSGSDHCMVYSSEVGLLLWGKRMCFICLTRKHKAESFKCPMKLNIEIFT